MTSAELEARDQLDRDILAYVREMQQLAPVTAESVLEFEQRQRRRRVTLRDIRDRLGYLTDAGYLKVARTWQAGAWIDDWLITADGADVLDGAKPPRSEL